MRPFVVVASVVTLLAAGGMAVPTQSLPRTVVASASESSSNPTDLSTLSPRPDEAPAARPIDDACPPAAVPEDGFADAASSLHESAIDCVVWWDVAHGTTATTYDPSRPVTRAQMASFVARLILAAGASLPDGAADAFTDDDGGVHESSINALAAVGIVWGQSDSLYGPANPVTRAQIATLMVRAYTHLSNAAMTASRDYFTDDDGNVHEDNINRAAEAGFTGGHVDGYRPVAAATRAQTASFVARVLDLAVGHGVATFPPATRGSVEPIEWWLTAETPDREALLVITSFGGVASGCARWEAWEAGATPDRVEVQALLWQAADPPGCTEQGVGRTLRLSLGHPLGERSLVGCGHDDCATAALPDWLSDSSWQALAVGEGVGVAVAGQLLAFDGQGQKIWARPAEDFALFAAGDALALNDGGDVVVVDAATGQPRWQVTGVPVAATDEQVLVCTGSGPGFELEGGGMLEARDVATGAILWQAESPCESIARAGDRWVIIGPDFEVDGGHQLVVLDAGSGNVVEQRPLSDGVDDRVNAYSSIVGGEVAVTGGYQGDLVVIDDTGVEIGRFPQARGIPMALLGEAVLLGTLDGVAAVSLTGGEVLWRRSDVDSRHVTAAGHVVLAADGAQGMVSRLDPATGGPLWTRHVGRTSGIGAAAPKGNGAVYVVTDMAVLGLDAATGAIRWWKPTGAPVTDELDLHR